MKRSSFKGVAPAKKPEAIVDARRRTADAAAELTKRDERRLLRMLREDEGVK